MDQLDVVRFGQQKGTKRGTPGCLGRVNDVLTRMLQKEIKVFGQPLLMLTAAQQESPIGFVANTQSFILNQFTFKLSKEVSPLRTLV